MRKTLPYLGVWFVAGLLAMVLASAGVSMVTDRVTVDRPAPLSATQVRDELAGAAETPAADVSAGTVGSNPAAPTPSIEPLGDPSTGESPPSGGSGSTTTSAPPSGANGPAPTTPTAPPVTPASVTRTYDLIGGTVTLRFTSTGVTVVTATPKAGFSVDIGEGHDNGARVEFEREDHQSRLDGWWDHGPQDEVREED